MSPSDAQEPVVLIPESMPALKKPPRKGSFFIKTFCTLIVLCICAGLLWYWWSGQPLKLEGKVFKSAEIWTTSDREGKISEIFVEPGQVVIRDEPLLSFQLGKNEILKTEAMLLLALLEGEASSDTVKNLTKNLRDMEHAAEKEMQKCSTDLSRAVYERRKLESNKGSGKVSRAQLDQAQKKELQAAAAYKAATEHFEQVSHSRAQSLTHIEKSARTIQTMSQEERRHLAATYQEKIMEADKAAKALFLRSPIDGVVLEVRASKGMRIYPSLELVSVAPEKNAVFVCRALVDAKTAKKIIPGAYCEALSPKTDTPYPGRVYAVRNLKGRTAAQNKGQTFVVVMEFSGDYKTLAPNLQTGMSVTMLIYKKDFQKQN